MGQGEAIEEAMSDNPYAQCLHAIQCVALGIKGGGFGYPVFTPVPEPEPSNVYSIEAARSRRATAMMLRARAPRERPL
jgi:hypothetical protein